MCSLATNHGKEPRQAFVIQLKENRGGIAATRTE
jgi:hypothetical protein